VEGSAAGRTPRDGGPADVLDAGHEELAEARDRRRGLLELVQRHRPIEAGGTVHLLLQVTNRELGQGRGRVKAAELPEEPRPGQGPDTWIYTSNALAETLGREEDAAVDAPLPTARDSSRRLVAYLVGDIAPETR
jgi:hypothetical protein